ncbi:Iridoid synthase [Heracleum sosnowskyi]|uniref:Iridoid synthase n=1 Tax=Heracleum sosnowskyi TaxID=360622 RepID=A0AAD8IY67_9APIA|nr:Iridoid synthase [Heracleum sosnowskyi]
MAIKDLAAPHKNVAVIFGSTGLVGRELARRLLSRGGWKVYGVARKADVTCSFKDSNYHFISCDLLQPAETRKRLSFLQDVTHIFWITWASEFPLDSRECCEQNKAMMSNALNALLPTAKALRHFSLQTGVKHYISLQGPFDVNEVRYYNEECPRLSTENNFYYTLEDLLKERLGGKVAWSVHRPGLILGNSQRALYNFMGSLCVYGTICKHLNLPFMFGGSRECWEEMCIDGSDVRSVWKEIVAKEGLVGTEMEDLANFQFLDHLFRCPTKMLATRDKADRLGLTAMYETLDSILYWVDDMRKDKLIP